MIFKSFCNRSKNAASEGQKQKDSPGFSFLMSYTSRSPGLSLFDSSVSDSEISSDQVKKDPNISSHIFHYKADDRLKVKDVNLHFMKILSLRRPQWLYFHLGIPFRIKTLLEIRDNV